MKLSTYIVVILIFWAGCNHNSSTNTDQPPNIIFIMSDDHAYQAISAYDSSLIRTPNIDRIAREGAIFNQAFVTNSICGPSRAVILTGKYSHKNGFVDNGDQFEGSQRTFPKILRANGYRTAVVGKWHLGTTPTGFDYWNVQEGQGHYYNPTFMKMGKDTVYNGYVTDITTNIGLDWISQQGDNPFLLMLHHKAPHRNWMPPMEYLETFNDRDFNTPETFGDQYENRQALQRQKLSIAEHLSITYDSKIPCDTCMVKPVHGWAPAEWKKEYGRLSKKQKKKWERAYQDEYRTFSRIKTNKERIDFQFQRYMEDYLRAVKSVDDNVGKVLNYLEENGLAENTIVVYTSDQGFFLGEHGLYDKRFMYEPSFRTPLMIRYPKDIKSDQAIDRFAVNTDLAPTFLDYAGIEKPGDMQGTSLKPLMNDQQVNNWRDEVYYRYNELSFGLTAHYGIRTRRYKLIHFYDPIDTWELYDLQKDPNEMHNRIDDPQYQPVIDSLKIELKNQQKALGDTLFTI